MSDLENDRFYAVIGFAWLISFVGAIVFQSIPAAICFAAICYGIAHWETKA